MSLFRRIWSFIRHPTGFVGKDLQGNHFYEYVSANGGRTRRVVKFRGKDDMLAIANRNRLLAVQWKAWLTHTRSDAPTLQELQADLLRMERLRQNVALIEARDLEARLQLQSPATGRTPEDRSVASHLSSTHGSARSQASDKREAPLETARENRRGRDVNDPWIARPASDEPEAWKPRMVARGS